MTSSYIWSPPSCPWMFVEHDMDEIYERVYAVIHAVVPIGIVFKRSINGGQKVLDQMIVPNVGVISKLISIDFGLLSYAPMDGEYYYMFSQCGEFYSILAPCRVTDPTTEKLMDTKAVFFGNVECDKYGRYKGVCMWSAYNTHELLDGIQQTRISVSHIK